MPNKNWLRQVVLVVVLALLVVPLVRCAPATPEEPPAEETAAPEEPEEPTEAATEEPEEEEEEAAGPQTGGYATLVFGEDPPTLNLTLNTVSMVRHVVEGSVVEGLVDIAPEGHYRPLLAEQLPSLEDGTVSEDGLTITWTLREGLQWNDGEPVTSEDIYFTWEAVMASGVDRAGFDQIEEIELADELTAAVTYSEFYVDYLGQFKYLLPAHAGDPENMEEWDYNRDPIGTGPFMLEEWAVDDHITLVRNPYYREEGKPYLDGIIMRIIPDFDTQFLMLEQGEVDVMYVGGIRIAEVREMENVDLVESEIGWITGLWFNLADPAAGGQPEPPHPILGDPKVRLAIKKALDWDQITYGVYDGLGMVNCTTPFPYGWHAVDLPAEPIDLEGAEALLEEAGWIDEDGDGVRECHGCMYADEGTALYLRLEGYKWGADWEQAHFVVADMLAEIGIEVEVQMDELAYMYGTDAPMFTGDFDMILTDARPGADPQEYAYSRWHSSQIPTVENQGVGKNIDRYVNEDVDAWLEEAGSIPDIERRKELYRMIAEQIDQDNPVLYGVIATAGVAYSERLNGWEANFFWDRISNSENWWIEE